jgi:outer membrane protein insertion porin family
MPLGTAGARRLGFSFVAAMCLSLDAADLAPAIEYEGKPIASVEFEPPSQPITRADLSHLMLPFQNGAPLHLAEVRAAIKKLYGTGLYSNIEVDTEASANGVRVVIRTTEQWFVGPLEVRGKVNQPPNVGQLANASRLQLGTPFTDDQIQTAVNGIQNLFQRNGLYRATIEPKIERDAEHQEVALTFTVKAGKRARLMTPIVTGDTRLPPAEVAKAAKYKGWTRWKPATEDNIREGVQDVRERYDKDHRLTADVTLTHEDYLAAQNRVQPTIDANGGPKVKITSQGGKISQGKLKKYVPVFAEGTVNRDLLVRGVGSLRDYFQDQGYFDVQVDFQTANPTPDQENITYIVGLGERQKLVRVDITGNHFFRRSDIRERMFLQPAGFIRLRHGRYSQDFATRDEDAIKALYQDNGFEDVKVTITTSPNYKGKKGDVAATVTIDEGVQYKVAALNVEGVTLPNRSQILGQLASAAGEPFSRANVASDRDYLLRVYQSAGYLDASFDWSANRGPGQDEETLSYTVTAGMPRYVRDVLLSGLRGTRHRLVAPLITLKPGDPVSWEKMGQMQQGLYNLGVFDTVDMAVQNPQGDTENKYVLYHMTEGHRYQMAVGFGAELAQIGGSQTSLSNPAGTTGFAPEGSFDLSRLNMWGLGHRIDFRTAYSTLDRKVSLTYLIPRFRNVEGRNISFTGLYDNERDVLTFTARRVEGDAQISQKLSKATQVLWRYSWQNVVVDQSTLKINPLLIPLYSQPANVGMLSATLIQDRRDDPVNAHRGIYNTLNLGLAESYFGGNKNFMRLLARSSYYKRITGDWVLATNVEFGWIHPFSETPGVSAFDYIPLPERFFGGGSNSMRGFPDNQAGPRDPLTGFPLGGNALLFQQTEVRFPFIGENISGVLFHDMGNIYKDVGSISFRVRQNALVCPPSGPTSLTPCTEDFRYMVHAVGFGIRYKTPVGPVRVDLAYSINPPTFYGLVGTYQQLLNNTATPQVTSVSHFQFFISIGQAF